MKAYYGLAIMMNGTKKFISFDINKYLLVTQPVSQDLDCLKDAYAFFENEKLDFPERENIVSLDVLCVDFGECKIIPIDVDDDQEATHFQVDVKLQPNKKLSKNMLSADNRRILGI